MKRGMKKLVAGILMATLLMGSTLAVNAEEEKNTGSAVGSGALEGTVETDVFDVTLPTEVTDASKSPFTFILDPEGLIAATSNERYADSDFEDGATVFFNNDKQTVTTDEGDKELTVYKSTSLAQTIENYSTYALDVTVTATVADLDTIVMTKDNTFADDTAASLYLALKDSTQEIAVEGTTATMTAELAAIDKAAYDYAWDSTNSVYTYELIDDLTSITVPEYSFQLTGKCNTEGDWSELASAAPSVSVVWKVERHVEAAAPSLTTATAVAVKDTTVDITFALGEGNLAAEGIDTITFVNPIGETKTLVADTDYSVADNKITLSATIVNNFLTAVANNGLTERDYTITFDDDASTVVTFKLTAE